MGQREIFAAEINSPCKNGAAQTKNRSTHAEKSGYEARLACSSKQSRDRQLAELAMPGERLSHAPVRAPSTYPGNSFSNPSQHWLHEAQDRRIGEMSTESATNYVSLLLSPGRCSSSAFMRSSVDSLVAQILDANKLLEKNVVDDKKLLKWLDSCHAQSRQIPLCRVMFRLLDVVNDGDHIFRCAESILLHVQLKGAQLSDQDSPCFALLARLLCKLAHAQDGQVVFNFCHAVGLVCSEGCVERVLQCLVESVPGYLQPSNWVDKVANSLVLGYANSISCLHDKVSLTMESLRLGAQSGLAVRPSATDGSTGSQALESLLKLMLCVSNKKSLQCLVKWALWLSKAGAQLDLDNSVHKRLFDDVSAFIPEVRDAVLLRCSSLMEVCVRVICHQVPGDLAESSGALPVSVMMQERIADGYLCVDPEQVDWLTECIAKRISLPLEVYDRWRTLFWPYTGPDAC